jgi:hypothetical protein
MKAAKGFLSDFINKKLTLLNVSVQKGSPAEPFDEFAIERYKMALLCLTRNSRQELKEIMKFSPPFMNERLATEEFLKNVSKVAEEFSDEFANAIVALARIVLWKDNNCLDKFPADFVSDLDSAIKEIFSDTGSWGNIAWGAIAKNTENFLTINFHDIMAVSVYSRAVTILVSYDDKITKQFFDSFRADAVKAIVINIIQPMAHSLGSENPLDDDDRQMLLDKLSLLQSCILAV